MKQLIAYDFDKTLIPYDSFRRYLWHLICIKPWIISCLLLLRKLRIISSRDLKKRITDMVASSTRLTQDAKAFAHELVNDISTIQHDENSTILIITASPMIYMKYIAEELKCQLICSDYIDNEYIEMYGIAKAECLHRIYPPSSYQYKYATSDSKSDICWMKDFINYELIERI